VVYLMYHELEASGRVPCHSGPGYLRYLVPESDFRAQLAALKVSGLRGLNVSQALASEHSGAGVVITFDDGCETDLAVAAPLLKALGFQATFYLVPGFLGCRGYLAPGQARELGAMGYEIGCHSMTHPYLTGLAPRELRAETVEAKALLEQVTGQAVHHFSCPGGRWNREVARVAAGAGYRSVATSRAGGNGAGSNPFRLSRVAVLRGVRPEELVRIARGRGLATMRLKQAFRSSAQLLLGDAAYDRLRGALLRGSD